MIKKPRQRYITRIEGHSPGYLFQKYLGMNGHNRPKIHYKKFTDAQLGGMTKSYRAASKYRRSVLAVLTSGMTEAELLHALEVQAQGEKVTT